MVPGIISRPFHARAISKMERSLLPSPVRIALFQARNPEKDRFVCPVCGYRGPFDDLDARTGLRQHAACPACGSLERHRLQQLVMDSLGERLQWFRLSMLHFAPEACLRETFRRMFGRYTTADLSMVGVDHHVDLCRLPFADESYDVVFASHVLHHIKEDERALREIRRVLKPHGVAILPVPIIADATIEYPEANPEEHFFWRAPGRDYFDTYRRVFSKVEEFDSTSFSAVYQTFLHEDRTGWPTDDMLWRRPMAGSRHLEVVPVCHKRDALQRGRFGWVQSDRQSCG